MTVDLWPERAPLLIDLGEGVMSVKDSEVSMLGLSSPDQVLARYLAFVYHMRNLPVGTPINLRGVDLEVLSDALQLEKADVESRLHQLIADEEAVASVQRRFRLRTLAPVAGVVLAVCSAGLLVASLGGSPEPETDISTASVVTLEIVTDIGAGGAVEFNPET